MWQFYIDNQSRQEEQLARLHDREVDAWQLLTTHASGNSGKRWALEYLISIGQELEKIDLSGSTYLQSAKLAGGYFAGANFSGNDLGGADFKGAKLSGARFNHSNLNLTEFNAKGTDLLGATFWNAKLLGTKFAGADLLGADFSGALMKPPDLRMATMISSYFSPRPIGRNSEQIRFYQDLLRPDFREAKNLTCEQLTQATGWEFAYRDASLACGADIPTPPSSG